MNWHLLFIVIAIAGVVGAVYMTWTVCNFAGIKKLAKERKGLKIIISAGIVAVFFLICTLAFSVINAVIIFIHVLLFRLLFDILGLIVKIFYKGKPKFYWQGWFSIAACIIYLSAGYYLCNNVWMTEYSFKTDKAVGDLKIAMFADSHLGTTFDGDGFAEKIDMIMDNDPDILFIVGDFVDDGTTKEEMLKACKKLGEIKPELGIWYVWGNHDRGYSSAVKRGFSQWDLEIELKKNGVKMLEDDVKEIDDRIIIAGRGDASFRGRLSAEELLKGVEEDKYIIVLDHQPTDYEGESATAADLVLSGHTHGGQFFPLTKLGEWIGANDRTYGHENRNGTDFVVTSGISDWEIKFKTGTKSEYVIINIDGADY